MKYLFKTQTIKMLSDTHTPVELYLKLRDKFPQSFLLESSDYESKENSFSYIGLKPVAEFKADEYQTEMQFPDGTKDVFNTKEINAAQKLFEFSNSFESEDFGYEFQTNGLFGYTSYDAIPLFENISFKERNASEPLIHYYLFHYIIVFNHFNNELYLFEHLLGNEESTLEELKGIIEQRVVSQFKFETKGQENRNFTNDEFIDIIEKGKRHVFLGDVFQIVFSRKFSQSFQGDEFNVYRALRSINPSPYLFYFDYGNFKIFGSSPEAQLTIENDVAVINPIAGTFKRTGDLKTDQKLAQALNEDPKENAEHIMLVDLARNDLSKHSKKVSVDKFKEVEYYSHVIHLVSKVKAELGSDYNSIEILGDSYPAGTLSGAPKHKAMELIDFYEPDNRGFYGGTLGIIGFNGMLNHAIFIRSFVSKDNVLHYQAGCGIVAHSDPQSELEEVDNKLSALRKAIEQAKNM